MMASSIASIGFQVLRAFYVLSDGRPGTTVHPFAIEIQRTRIASKSHVLVPSNSYWCGSRVLNSVQKPLGPGASKSLQSRASALQY